MDGPDHDRPSVPSDHGQAEQPDQDGHAEHLADVADPLLPAAIRSHHRPEPDQATGRAGLRRTTTQTTATTTADDAPVRRPSGSAG